MKTRRLWSGMLLGGTLALGGCGAGQYQIPNVEPVVKQKPEDDLLQNIEGTSTEKPAETAAPSEPAPGSSGDTSDSSKSGDSAKPAKK